MELCNSRPHSLIIDTVNSRLRVLLQVADPEKRPGSRPPPPLDQTGPEGPKNFLRPAAPHTQSRGLDDRPPPPYVKFWIRH